MTRRLIDADKLIIKKELLERLLEMMQGVYCEYHQDILEDELKDTVDLITNTPTVEPDSGEAVAYYQPEFKQQNELLAEVCMLNTKGGINDFDHNIKENFEIKDKWLAGTPLFTSPQKREWVDLTDADIKGLPQANYDITTSQYVKLISAKLKEVNHV